MNLCGIFQTPREIRMSQKPVTCLLCRLFLMIVLVGLALSNSEFGVFSVHAETVANQSSTTSDLTLVNLAITKSGSGSGTITSDPAGIDCGLTCAFDFAPDTVVTLTALADTGSIFTGWSGGGCTGTGTCIVTMTTATTVTANFDLQTFILTVNKTGLGSGTVTSNPAGINCGVDCSESYSYNTSVTLTATAGIGSTFTGWSGGGCTGTGTCIVTMTTATTVTANFDLQTRTLTVTKTGNGVGGVTSNPVGIDCGLTCSASYPYSTSVTLTAAAGTG